MKKINGIALIIIVLILIGGGFFLFKNKETRPSTPTTTEKRQSSDKYGLSFIMPTDYGLLEGEKGTGASSHYAYVFIKQEDFTPRPNGEGPPTISIDIYPNTNKQSVSTWFHTDASSNSKLTATGGYASTTVAGKEALSYRWSGLYEGETVAFEHKGNIIALSGNYLSPEDKNIPTFKRILESIELK